jgi:hypothetical protein
MRGEFASDTNSFDYQERSVAFIDVLGFAELVKQSAENKTAREKIGKLIAANKLFEQFMLKYFNCADSAFFSDSFVISVPWPRDQLIYLVRETGFLCRYLLVQGLLCRGAITTGALFHTGRFVVGPALVDAVRLEQSVAIYPRIIIDNATMEYWNADFRLDEFGQGCAHQQCEVLVKRDRDGQHFLDIFSPEWPKNFFPWTEFIPSAEFVPTDPADFCEEARKRIMDGCAANSHNPKVVAKYKWLATECEERASALANAR